MRVKCRKAVVVELSIKLKWMLCSKINSKTDHSKCKCPLCRLDKDDVGSWVKSEKTVAAEL